MNLISNFAFVPKDLDKGKVLGAWKKLSEKYEPGAGKGTSRRTMLTLLENQIAIGNEDNVRLLMKKHTPANGVPGYVYTGAAHANIKPNGKEATIHTIAGNPLSVKNKKYSGALGSLKEDLNREMDASGTVEILAVKKNKPLYEEAYGYMGEPMPLKRLNKAHDNYEKKKSKPS